MSGVVSVRRQANRCERLASHIADPMVAENLRGLAVEHSIRAGVGSDQVRSLMGKATNAHERALRAAFPEDQQFWLEMEGKWRALAGSAQHVERTCDFLAAMATNKPSRRPQEEPVRDQSVTESRAARRVGLLVLVAGGLLTVAWTVFLSWLVFEGILLSLHVLERIM